MNPTADTGERLRAGVTPWRISAYLKVIGRGREGARALDRSQAADLMGQVLDGQVSDLTLGAFCMAMRFKGETPPELAGFLDAVHGRLTPVQTFGAPTVVLPSYNGARKLPVLTPLLALLLAREGIAVVVHGQPTEDSRVTSQEVFAALDMASVTMGRGLVGGQVSCVSTELLHPGLAHLLNVRRFTGLRNCGHSLVKLMNPCDGPALLVSSYTHPDHLQTLSATFGLTGQHALLLRGTEGEPVADVRRTPAMDVFKGGETRRVQTREEGPVTVPPDMASMDVQSTVDYIKAVLRGDRPVPQPVARQIHHILQEFPR